MVDWKIVMNRRAIRRFVVWLSDVVGDGTVWKYFEKEFVGFCFESSVFD